MDTSGDLWISYRARYLPGERTSTEASWPRRFRASSMARRPLSEAYDLAPAEAGGRAKTHPPVIQDFRSMGDAIGSFRNPQQKVVILSAFITKPEPPDRFKRLLRNTAKWVI